MGKPTIKETEDGLPSYDDVMKEEGQVPAYTNTQPSSHLQTPPRPSGSLSSSSSFQSHTSNYSNYNVPPPMPNRPQPQQPYNPQPQPNMPPNVSNLPWTYPKNFRCPKCNNTGYKLKNGHSCRSCWRRFAPVNRVNMQPTSYGYYSSGPMYTGPGNVQYGQPYTSAAPLMVRPGDPRLGGVICGECRGSGRIRFFLDEDICPLCHGIGRIIGHA